MEKKTLDHFKQIVAEKYGYKNWDALMDCCPYWHSKLDDFENEALDLYAEYCREDQHKIAVDMTLEWVSNNAEFDHKLDNVIDRIKLLILKGKTDKSLQYEKD